MWKGIACLLLTPAAHAFVTSVVGRHVTVPCMSSPADTEAPVLSKLVSGTKELLKVTGLSNTYDGDRWQFKNIDFNVCAGQKLGLVGLNGCGKSTLLKVIAGIEDPDEGSIESPKQTSICYVEQDPVFPPGATCSDVLYGADIPILRAVRQYQIAAQMLTDGAKGAMSKFEAATTDMDTYNGWDLEVLAEKVLTKLHMMHLLDKEVDKLSGGERKRIALATALLQRPSILILDEPTNHLDFFAIDWLEQLLTEDKSSTVLLVTHDRYFLENVCQEILELDAGRLFRYPGSYATFLENKSERIMLEAQSDNVERMQMLKELEWMRKQPKARQAKSKKREEGFRELKARVDAQKGQEAAVKLQSETTRLGNSIMKFKGANLRFDKTILRDFTYEFNKGDRVGVVGPNGVGKTTFLRVLMQQQPLDEGTVTTGETVRIGYYDQKGEDYDENKRVLAIVEDICAGVEDEAGVQPAVRARRLLSRFKFPSSRYNDRYGRLSGGEKRRLQLMGVLANNPNFLVLDEPSNDLDLQTLEVLEDFLLNEYKGCLIVVSHDRWFMSRVTDHLFIFEGDGKITDYLGTLNEYAYDFELRSMLESSGDNGSVTDDVSSSSSDVTEKAVTVAMAAEPSFSSISSSDSGGGADAEKKRTLLYKEQREYTQLEKDMEKLTKRQTKLTELMSSAYEKPEKVSVTDQKKWTEELGKIAQELAMKEERWLELAEYA